MKKLPARYNTVAMPLVLSMIMSFIISFVSSWRALGLINGFLMKWLPAWGISWLIAFPTVLFVLPLARKIVSRFVEAPGAR
jgi:Protein of unknown function (DUF2798)